MACWLLTAHYNQSCTRHSAAVSYYMKPDRNNERALLQRGSITVQFIWHQSLNGVAFKLTQDLLPYKPRRQDLGTIILQIKTNEKIEYFLENLGKLWFQQRILRQIIKSLIYVQAKRHICNGFLVQRFPICTQVRNKSFSLGNKRSSYRMANMFM